MKSATNGLDAHMRNIKLKWNCRRLKSGYIARVSRKSDDRSIDKSGQWEMSRRGNVSWNRRGNRGDSSTRKCSLHNNEGSMCVCGVPLGVAP